MVRFPAIRVESADAFRAFRAECADLLDERYRRERTFATSAPQVVLDGTCTICLAASEFTSMSVDGDALGNGVAVPNWREQQVCGCAFRLGGKQRAVLHRAGVTAFGLDLAAPGLFGPDPALQRYLAARQCAPTVWSGFGGNGGGTGGFWQLADHCLDVVLSVDWLQRVPLLDAGLREIARVLMPGGEFLFTVPFHFAEDKTVSDMSHLSAPQTESVEFVAQAVHSFGWDLMSRVVAAGFETCVAWCYWSEEFGYLGPFNLLFSATR